MKNQIKSSGQCQTRYPPQSTFKLAIALMGFEAGILQDELHPVIPFKKGYPDYVESWKHSQEPTSWIKNSCVWYSQFITKKLGIGKFKKYLKQFNYGNQDTSGTVHKPNGLADAWITSSLKISPEEQIVFLENFLNQNLGLTKQTTSYSRNLFFLEDFKNGWKLYGKTGTGDLLNPDGSNNREFERGWFIGWVEKNNERIIFTQYLELRNIKVKNFSYIASKKAKEMAIKKVSELVLD